MLKQGVPGTIVVRKINLLKSVNGFPIITKWAMLLQNFQKHYFTDFRTNMDYSRLTLYKTVNYNVINTGLEM